MASFDFSLQQNASSIGEQNLRNQNIGNVTTHNYDHCNITIYYPSESHPGNNTQHDHQIHQHPVNRHLSSISSNSSRSTITRPQQNQMDHNSNHSNDSSRTGNRSIDQPTMNKICATSRNVLRSNFRGALNMLVKLSGIERFALFVMKKYWIPQQTSNINANTIVKECMIGGLLNLSFEAQDIGGLFNGLTTENIEHDPQVQRNLKTSFEEYRLIMSELQQGMYTVLNNFVRIKRKECKENVLRLLSYFVFINLDRGKMRFNHKTVSSDGFMLNLNYVMLALCDPIIKRNMVNKIDANYFLMRDTSNARYMTWEDSTRMNADAQEIKTLQEKLYSSSEEEEKEINFGFTTEIFCLTLEALHLGFGCVDKISNTLQVQIERLRRDARGNPMAAFMIKMSLQRLETQFLAQIAHLHDPRFILKVGSFYGFLCKYLLYLGRNGMKDKLSVIPEYFIEDMSRFFRLFLTERGFVQMIERGQSPFNREEVIECLIYLMSGDTPIRNIYQRACLCEVLLYFLPRKVLQPQIKWNSFEFESHEFNRFPHCQTQLVETLLILYSDVERTGSPGQYHEKFKFRTIITRILKFLFAYRVHQENLIRFWENAKDKFIAFLNMLINDLIYTLDHGFDGLTEIRQLEVDEVEMANELNAFDPFNPTQSPQNTQENISQMRDTIRHYMKLANESIELLQYVCNATCQPFMDHLILPRVAVLVSVYLDRLANESELRVKGNLREDYNFNARFLLTSVVQIFNKLCDDEQGKDMFLDAIVEDEAHFEPKSYQKGINVLRKKSLMNLNDVALFEQSLSILCDKLKEKRNIEVRLGNNSDFVMDRKVIERHRMNNPNNPFNRKPRQSDQENVKMVDKMSSKTQQNKPFKCHWPGCTKAYKVSGNLVHHRRTHSGEKPFECDLCAKSFTLKYQLVVHIRTHTGEKPYQCNHCKKRFGQKGNMTKHRCPSIRHPL
eukprot:159272_1